MLQWVFEQLPETLQKFIIGLAESLAGTTGGVGGQAGAEALNTIGSNIMGVVSFIGWAYAGYQIANMAYQMIFACTEDEQKVGVALIGKKCFWVYTKKPKKVLGVRMGKTKKFHCCYNNVLSRIIMEQASVQLGWTKRQYYDQGCNGLDFTQLGKVDFDKIDFSEWIDMMAQNNMIPDNKTQDDITKGNMMNGYGRMSTKERMDERGKGNVYVEHVKEMNKLDMGNKIDCSSYPRPAFCDTLNSYDRNNGL